MKEQRERLISNAVEANLGTIEGTQSRFVDAGFVAPVTQEPVDYATGFINAIKAGTDAIETSDNYKVAVASDKADGMIDAEEAWAHNWAEIDLMADPETGLPFTPPQKEVEAAKMWDKTKATLAASDKSGYYKNAFIGAYATSLKNDTVKLITDASKNERNNRVADYNNQFIKGGLGQADYRTATKSTGMSQATQSANLLQMGTTALNSSVLSYYAKQDRYKEHTTELTYQKKASGIYNEKHKDIVSLMQNSKMTFQEAQSVVIDKVVQKESKDINPENVVLQSILNIQGLHMAGDPKSSLLNNLKTTESYAAQKAITKAFSQMKQYKDLDSFDPTRTSLESMNTRLSANAIDGKALSTAVKARAENKVLNIMAGDLSDIWQGKASGQQVSRLNNMLALNSQDKGITDKHKELFRLTMDGLIASPEVDTLATLNLLENVISADRTKNSAIWGLMDSMPRWQTALLARELGASPTDVEQLLGSFDENDYDDNGVIKLQGVSKKEAQEIFVEAREVIDDLPIMQGDYKKYLNITATIMMVNQRTGGVELDVLKEKMLGAATFNVGAPIGDMGEKDFRLPNSYKKSIALNAQAPGLVATATFLAIENQGGEALKSLPHKTVIDYDEQGQRIKRSAVDWDKVETRWIQISPGNFRLRLEADDIRLQPMDITDELISNTIEKARNKRVVEARKRKYRKAEEKARQTSKKKKRIQYKKKEETDTSEDASTGIVGGLINLFKD